MAGLLPPGYKGSTFMGAQIAPLNYDPQKVGMTGVAPTQAPMGPGLSSSSTLIGNTTTGTPTVDVGLPDWLTKHPDDLQSELLSQYGSAGSSIINASKKAAKQSRQAANIDYGQNVRQAANATAQLAAVSKQQGGTAKTSSIVGGQMVQSAQQQRQDAKVQIAQMKMDAVTKAAGLSSQIAGNLANMRASYLTSLAGISTQQRGQNIQSGQFQQSFNAAQQAQKFAQEQTTAATAKQDALEAAKPPSGMYYTGNHGVGMGSYLGQETPTTINGGAGQHLYPGWGG